ncbi:MAG: DUF4367 domain-containing protein [Clostridia bacterium]|nr:DUF4367 domain-containing protein [Clostridia bacterium]
MTFSNEELKNAFVTVLTERVPAPVGGSEHVFSARFERRMKKLIAREAACSPAVMRPAVKKALIAAVVFLLMLILCLSVSGIREMIYGFFVRHFDTHDEIVFEASDKTRIEREYEITALPDGFELKERHRYDAFDIRHYENAERGWIVFEQIVPSASDGPSLDNERSTAAYLEIDGISVYCVVGKNVVTLYWSRDGYEFSLEAAIDGFSLNDAIALYRSVIPAEDGTAER